MGVGGWNIHLKDGRTLTEKNCYPHDVEQEDISSVERIVGTPDGPKIITIMKSDAITNLFVKTTASRDMVAMGRGVHPTVIQERIVGAYVPPQELPVRIDLIMNPKTGNVKLKIVHVNIMRKDGL